jgi:hypothetical protein
MMQSDLPPVQEHSPGWLTLGKSLRWLFFAVCTTWKGATAFLVVSIVLSTFLRDPAEPPWTPLPVVFAAIFMLFGAVGPLILTPFSDLLAHWILSKLVRNPSPKNQLHRWVLLLLSLAAVIPVVAAVWLYGLLCGKIGCS